METFLSFGQFVLAFGADPLILTAPSDLRLDELQQLRLDPGDMTMGTSLGHMVSRGYLAVWADNRNTVDVIDIQVRRGFPSSVFTATAVSDVYNFKVLAHDLEDTYAKK